MLGEVVGVEISCNEKDLNVTFYDDKGHNGRPRVSRSASVVAGVSMRYTGHCQFACRLQIRLLSINADSSSVGL